MANAQAWQDWKKLYSLGSSLKQSLDNYKARYEEFEEFVLNINNNQAREDELKKIIDEDPNWDLSKIQNKYLEFKAIYDYLTQ